jgi:hypothetical protein
MLSRFQPLTRLPVHVSSKIRQAPGRLVTSLVLGGGLAEITLIMNAMNAANPPK